MINTKLKTLNIRLGGWHRLFILTTSLYVIFISFFAFPILFENPYVNYNDIKPYLKPWMKYQIDDAGIYISNKVNETQQIVELPDNQKILFKSGITDEQMEETAKNYYSAYKNVVSKKRAVNSFSVLAFYIFPPTFIYLLGSRLIKSTISQ